METNVYQDACSVHESYSDDQDYNEACTVSPSGISATRGIPVLNLAEVMSEGITATTNISEQPETSTDDAATDYIPGVGMRNPGQSRVWTSAEKKTISGLSLVLNCCLLGAVIFLALTMSELKISTRQLDKHTGKATANLINISEWLQQVMEKTGNMLANLEEHGKALDDIAISMSQTTVSQKPDIPGGEEEEPMELQELKAYCPGGYHKYRQLCYKVFKKLQNFSEASETCRAHGGTLAMPRDSGINAFLISLTAEVHKDAHFWIGLHDQRHEGQWEWIDGTELGTGYSGWRLGQPNNFLDVENCVAYGSHGWYDNNCRMLKHFICEVMPEDDHGK